MKIEYDLRMSSSSDKTLIGKILDAHGIRGEVYGIVFSGDNSWVDEIQKLTLGDSEYEVKKIKPHKKGFIASLKGVENRNQAEALRGSEIYVNSSLFVSEKGEQPFLNEVQNFAVKDGNLGDIGQVTGFSSNGIQDLLLITHGDKIYEIPFVEDFVSEIDYDQKIIYMNLPEGLLEINEKE